MHYQPQLVSVSPSQLYPNFSERAVSRVDHVTVESDLGVEVVHVPCTGPPVEAESHHGRVERINRKRRGKSHVQENKVGTYGISQSEVLSIEHCQQRTLVVD